MMHAKEGKVSKIQEVPDVPLLNKQLSRLQQLDNL